MKIIFLDIDGVLWTGENIETDGIYSFARKPVSELCRIMSEVPEVQIVISSTWRIGKSLSWLQDHFESQGFSFADRIIGVTPREERKERGLEIQDWLDKHPTKQFVILDDDSDMVHLLPHLIKTKSRQGLTKEDADKVIIKLRETIK